MGLGSSSSQKSYYPELVSKMAELERFRSLIDEVGDLILVFSAIDGIVTDANRAAMRVLGTVSAEPLVGLDIREVLGRDLARIIDPAKVSDRPRIVAEASLGSPPTMFEIMARHIGLDETEYIVVVGRDITERKRSAQILEDHRRQLEHEVERRTAALSATVTQLREAADVRNRFLAKMSHELRTPLNSIIGFSGVMLQGATGPLSDEVMRQLGMINTSGKHLLGLINDVMSYSRIEQGAIEVECTLFDSGQIVRRAIQMLEHEARRRELVLTERIAEDMPIMYSDVGKITQILTNLIENGLKYTDAGGVTVHADPDGEGGMTVKVIDTGNGIAPENTEVIWHEFRQLARPEGVLNEGTGLGLAICKRLADVIDAELGVESQLEAGSTFTFHVPSLEEGCLLSCDEVESEVS
jgi:signal transduction histidine kinase